MTPGQLGWDFSQVFGERAPGEEVQSEAQSYLDAEQYQTFIQQQSMQGMSQWMNMFGGQNNNSGGNNGAGSNGN